MGWAKQEFETIDPGDERLRRRALLLPDCRGSQLEVNCLIASGINAPLGAKHGVWRLPTDRVVPTLQAALALPIAWFINWLMRLGRTLPDLPADLLFEPDESRTALILNKKPVPRHMSTFSTVVRLIAQRGGFPGRKRDGEPGARTIWRGLQESVSSSSRVPVIPGSSTMGDFMKCGEGGGGRVVLDIGRRTWGR